MFQINKITRLAVGVFDEEGQIRISGQGMLKKVFLSAYMSEDNNRIQPPREHFYFNRNSHTGVDPALVRKVAIYFILSEEEAAKQVREWEAAFIPMIKGRTVRFGEYGSFRFDEHLDFYSETLSYYQWLPSVIYLSPGSGITEYTPLERRASEYHLSPVPHHKKRVLIPALWGMMGCLFAFAFLLWSGPLNMLIDRNAELNGRLVNVAPESYDTDNGLNYFNDTHGVNSNAIDSKTSDTIESSDKPMEVSGKNDILTNIEHGNSDTVNSPSVNLDTKSLSENFPVVSRRCTLIVGAFANPHNVERMVTRLQRYEVEVVTIERSTLTLVGAGINCSNSKMIDKLKDQIDPNSWIYKK